MEINRGIKDMRVFRIFTTTLIVLSLICIIIAAKFDDVIFLAITLGFIVNYGIYFIIFYWLDECGKKSDKDSIVIDRFSAFGLYLCAILCYTGLSACKCVVKCATLFGLLFGMVLFIVIHVLFSEYKFWC